MTKLEMLAKLSDLKDYSSDMKKGYHIGDEMYDIYNEDEQALTQAKKTVNTSLKMLHDIFENLAGQDMFDEMVVILMNKGYTKEDFDIIEIDISEVDTERVEARLSV